MEHARRETFEANEHPESVYTENARVLDESKVLECLETDLDNDDDRDTIVGIVSGLAIGAVLWGFFITAVIVAL